MKVLVSGASGFIGRAVVAALAKQRHEVVRLTRSTPDPSDPRLFQWDLDTEMLDPLALAGVEAVIHLAGENLAGKRWNPAFKARILESRAKGTRVLLKAIAEMPLKPKVFLGAGAIGIYGDRGNEELNEDSAPGGGFLAEVCKAWEAETVQAQGLGLRLVQMRFGMVLGPGGGVLKRMLLPFKLGVGGKIGGGRQYYSWITLDDLVQAILFFLTHEETRGVYNCVSPNPVTNAQFTVSLGRAVSRPALFPLPAFMARLVLGEMADALVLAGQRVNPGRLKAAGFKWQHPFIGEALNKIVNG